MDLLLLMAAPFADAAADSWGWVAAAGATGVALSGAVSTAIVAVWNARHKQKQEQTRDAIGYLQQHIERLDRQNEQFKLEVARCRAAELAAEQAAAEQSGYIVLLWESHRHLYAAAKAAGVAVGDPLPPPPRRARGPVVEAVFVQATQAHESGLLRRERSEAPPPEAQP